MANKLKVDELRSQLAQRGLDTSGTKPILVQRLESAISDGNIDNKSLNDEHNSSIGRKRQRESEEDVSVKVEDVDKLGAMGIRQLREQATLSGVSTIGLKKELLERLCADLQKRPEEALKEVNGSSKASTENVPNKVEDVENLAAMGIRQLREQATLRGVLTTGSKKDLLERLCAANSQKGPEEAPKEVNGSSKASEENVPNKVDDVEKLHAMGIRQLREQATLRGVLTTGSKKDLLERLCADSQKGSEETPQEVDRSAKTKLVTATKKGRAVLDQWLPEHIKAQYHVLEHGEEVYDAMLNQTNVGQNNNKFYVIQALESDDGGTFMVYNRWGRVGVKGQEKLHGSYSSRDRAINEFEQKFYDKTKNDWSCRKAFVCHPRCYTWLEMDYSEKETKSVIPKKQTNSIQPQETQLESRIAKFISLICNISMMRQQMMEIGYNAEKLPLGKLSKSTILKGYDVLKRISDVINQSDRKMLEQLSGEFYTVIPHDFGFRKMREFVIDTPFKLKSKLQMVEALGEIELASKLLNEDNEMQDDPLYSHYKRLQCKLIPLEVNSQEHSMIETYMHNTHAKTHSNFRVDIVQIFRISRQGESERFKKFSCAKNRMLLWHGSRLTNWTGILSQGLRIAPPEAPVTGYMFGKGVYFADMFSKSANYCYPSQASTAGVLLLCEVALGEMAECLNANYNADQLPKGKLSTKGVGSTAPDPSEFKALEDGTVVPLGKPKEQPGQKGSLLYNEYIVYNVDQIRMRYVIHVNFNFKR
ncbi:Poly [ADP-ribose] polymerase [Thalictrum thalictroides]|uniref:Poly [ADP-ribose] polymerase n=1 Tax=Thalictrum thalictroides TaxID=46969 RepID=A0A7J6WQA7_THATH|nr:Poly [ADP-ribose] polymerase [Thalictrum thalictroides]